MPRETLIQMRQGGIMSWASNNPVLAAGEFAVANDINLIKVGNGTTAFNSLGFFANTDYSNTFAIGQTILPKNTNSVGLTVTSTMRYALITSALVSSNGAQITYTYATNGVGLAQGLLAVGDTITVTGFSNAIFNKADFPIAAVTTGSSPTFTISASATPSASATGTSSTWFYETGGNISDVLLVNTTGPGGTVGTTQVNAAFKVTAEGNAVCTGSLDVDQGISTSTSIVSGGNVFVGASLIRSQLGVDGINATTGASITASGAIVRTSSSARYKQDIENAEYTYEDVLSLSPRTFRLKEEAEINPESRIYGGLVAEEVAEIESLKVFVNYIKQEDGTVVPDGIQYGEMVSALVSAIKHQDEVITALTARLETLEKKVK